MLKILGSPRKLCDGWTRREMLTAGGLGLAGMGLGDFFQLRELQAATSSDPTFGKAKACILLFLYGSPSQIELFDMKPDAPVEIRGELKPIRSSLPGCDVSELLPDVAHVMDRVTVVRSVTHEFPIHSVCYALSGVPLTDVPLSLNPGDPRHWPCIGSVFDYLGRQERGAKPLGSVPDNIALPFPMSSKRPAAPIAGFHPAYLGSAYAPIWTRFQGKGTRHVVRPQAGNNAYYAGEDPYLGIEPNCRFEIGAAGLTDDLTLDRLNTRQSLLAQFNEQRRQLDATAAGQSFSRHREQAFSLLSSERIRAALDISKEPLPLRESYGMTLFGQSALLARRLVEAGSRFVSVVWDEYGTINTAWDTHFQHYERLRNELCPGLNSALSALILDLEARGMLDETLVLVLSEHGRTPKLVDLPGGGRDHWSACYTNLLAGGGIARGRVVGKTDKIGAQVVERPMSPKEILATAYHLLGINPATPITNLQGRPLPLVDAEVARDLLA